MVIEQRAQRGQVQISIVLHLKGLCQKELSSIKNHQCVERALQNQGAQHGVSAGVSFMFCYYAHNSATNQHQWQSLWGERASQGDHMKKKISLLLMQC